MNKGTTHNCLCNHVGHLLRFTHLYRKVSRFTQGSYHNLLDFTSRVSISWNSSCMAFFVPCLSTETGYHHVSRLLVRSEGGINLTSDIAGPVRTPAYSRQRVPDSSPLTDRLSIIRFVERHSSYWFNIMNSWYIQGALARMSLGVAGSSFRILDLGSSEVMLLEGDVIFDNSCHTIHTNLAL